MPRTGKGNLHHTYLQGGHRKKSARKEELPRKPRNRSWTHGQKGQGGEGLSKGHGGSEGSGTGRAGPDEQE